MSETKTVPFAELLTREARSLAEDILRRELAKQDLPLPKETDSHIDAILKFRPELLDLAKQRVEARKDAYTESLRLIGIQIQSIKPIEVDI